MGLELRLKSASNILKHVIPITNIKNLCIIGNECVYCHFLQNMPAGHINWLLQFL